MAVASHNTRATFTLKKETMEVLRDISKDNFRKPNEMLEFLIYEYVNESKNDIVKFK